MSLKIKNAYDLRVYFSETPIETKMTLQYSTKIKKYIYIYIFLF